MLTIVVKILKVLNSESDPAQISLALCLALIMGLTPLFSLHNLAVLLLALLLRVNLTAFLSGWLVFSGIAYLVDPLSHLAGYHLLTLPALEGLWTALYNLTPLRMENFSNSIVMGSLAISLLLFLPLFFLSNFLIVKYRKHFLAWMEKTRLMQILKTSRLFTLYSSMSD